MITPMTALQIVHPPTLRSRPGTPVLERARGRARLACKYEGGETRLSEFYQSGSAKIRLPRVEPGARREAVLINTAGGVTGGDRLSYEVEAGAGTALTVTTQAAERIYRRSAGTAEVETSLAVGTSAHLDWLPQETIAFDRSALRRSLTADLAEDASLLAIESIVLGRAAMGETARSISLSDRWRVRRKGKLLFADNLRIEGDAVETLAGGATGKGASAFATLLLVASDAETRAETARASLAECRSEAGISAWNGMMVGRFIAPDGHTLRADLARLVETLRGMPMPRVWNC